MAEILPIRRKTLSNRSTIQVRAMSVGESLETFPCMQKKSAQILVQQIAAATDLVL